ncbi:MAG: MerR family transcriptional regulator [Hyphomicrobiales bacterium]
MEKSPEAFRTISEVGTDLDVPQHVLRFWETKFSQIKPMKRAGGRRYYRPNDVDLLRGIRHLLYGEGYTIKGVQKLLRENGATFAIEVGRTGALPAAAAQAASEGAKGGGVEARPAAKVEQSPSELGEKQRDALNKALKELEAARTLLATS